MLHVVDRLDDALRALLHLSDGVGGVYQVPVALPDHLPQLLLLLLDLPPSFAFDPTDLLRVVALEKNRRFLNLRDTKRQRRIVRHRNSKTTPVAAGTRTRKTGGSTLSAST